MLALSAYIGAAMKLAAYEILEDGTFYGRIPACPGVWANEATRLRHGDYLPVIDGLDINPREEAVTI